MVSLGPGQQVVKDEGGKVIGGHAVEGPACQGEDFALNLLLQWFSKYNPWISTSASAGTLLDMQVIRPLLRPIESVTLR